MSRLSFTEALDQALELLEQGHPLEYCVRQFPEYADELRPLLQVSDDLHRLASAPLPIFEKSVAEPNWDAILSNVPQHDPNPLKRYGAHFIQFLRSLQQHPVQRYASLAAALVILFVLSWQGSKQSTPDSPLYPIKRAAEQVEMGVALDATSRAELHIEFARRRFDELQRLATQTRRIEQPLLDEALTETHQAIHVAKQGGVGSELYTELSQLLSEANSSISELKDTVAVPAPDVLNNADNTVSKLRDDLENVSVAQAPTATPTAVATVQPTPTATRTATSTATPVPPVNRHEDVEAPEPARTPAPTSPAPKPTQPSAPTSVPTTPATAAPTTPPATPVPTQIPTSVPTQVPEPTTPPTPVPTQVPTQIPTPTVLPTPVPTVVPTPVPTPVPTVVPTPEPTPVPEPTVVPTPEPTPVPEPTVVPMPTELPTTTPVSPTQEPIPTVQITVTIVVPEPTETPVPTEEPTETPVPTIEPTAPADETPTVAPTAEPPQDVTPTATAEPTASPTAEPSEIPAPVPSETATSAPDRILQPSRINTSATSARGIKARLAGKTTARLQRTTPKTAKSAQREAAAATSQLQPNVVGRSDNAAARQSSELTVAQVKSQEDTEVRSPPPKAEAPARVEVRLTEQRRLDSP